MTRIVVATRSAHKLREIREILAGSAELELVDLEQAGVPESPEEEGIEVHSTFVANALAKARYFAARTHLPILADDSGLCVDALGGEPGVRSKRFSGDPTLQGPELDRANNETLLRRLQGVPPAERAAHYRCVVALVAPNAPERWFEGRCDGLILERPRGSGGFGYDPLFLLPAEGEVTFAELPRARKNELSHRARALRGAAEALARGWPGAEDPAGRPVDTPPNRT